MEKFARLVFEEQVPDDAQMPEILDRFKASLTYWLKYLEENPIGALEDIEMSEFSYDRQE